MKVFTPLKKVAVITFLSVCYAKSEQIPDITDIGSENFSKRELATQRLRAWATAHKKNATSQLLEYYFPSKDPEFRSRLLSILEDIQISSPKSYLGLFYLPEKLTIGGANRIVLNVKRLTHDSPAKLSGLTIGDKIITVDGKSFNENMNTSDVRAILGSLPGGEKIVFTILRADKRLSINVRPRAKKPKPEDIMAAQLRFKKWLLQREKEFLDKS